MARDLTKFFLEALKREFPFLSGWSPNLNTAGRPVTFKVNRILDPDTSWSLEFGRYNNTVDPAYTDGVTWVGVSDGGKNIEWIKLDEGKTTPADVLKDDTRFVLVKYEYRSELVYKNPGNVQYTLYKRGEQTVTEITKRAAREAEDLRKSLDN